MIKKEVIKSQKGVIITDAIVAILIILLFTGIVTTLMVNITLESTRIKMNSQQTDFATEIFEYAEELIYDFVTQDNLIKYINDKGLSVVSAGATIDTVSNPKAAYKIGIQVETYVPTDTTLPELDIIKIITLTI